MLTIRDHLVQESTGEKLCAPFFGVYLQTSVCGWYAACVQPVSPTGGQGRAVPLAGLEALAGGFQCSWALHRWAV